MKYRFEKLNFLMASVLVFFSIAASAGERYEFYNGIRSLGMGGARIAVVNDETSVLVNPAGLGKLRDHFITLVDPEVALGAKGQKVVGADLAGAINPREFSQELQENPDIHTHARGQVFPSLVFPNFGIGVLSKHEVNGMYDTSLDSPNNLRLNYYNDDAVVVGFNFRLFDGRLKIGFNLRGVNRTHIDRFDADNAIDPTTESLAVKDLAKEGFGVGSDVGMILTGPWATLPTLAVVARDVGHTSYTLNKGMNHNTAERPDSTKQTIDAAFAFFPIVAKRTRMSISAEMRDVLNATNNQEDKDDVMRRVHGGMELNISDALFFRAGWHQHYYTAGAELALMNYQFQLATYGEEIGTASNNREDRRYVLKFSFRF